MTAAAASALAYQSYLLHELIFGNSDCCLEIQRRQFYEKIVLHCWHCVDLLPGYKHRFQLTGQSQLNSVIAVIWANIKYK